MERLVLFLLALVGPTWANTECECQWKPPNIGEGGYLSRFGMASTKVQANAVRIFLMQQKIKELQELMPKMTKDQGQVQYVARDVDFRIGKLLKIWHEYKGCYRDNSQRLMRGLRTKDHKVVWKHDNTILKCAEYCLEKGFDYAGVEFYSECFCSNDIPNSVDKLSERLCNTPCPGNQDYNCGGHWALSIFSTTEGMTGCDDKQFRCPVSGTCINSILACDGYDDCEDGSDEADEMCASSEIPVGSVWNGTITWHRCKSIPTQDFSLYIYASKMSKTFPWLKWWATVTLEGEDTYSISGHYDFSHRRDVTFPVDYSKGQAGFICEGNADYKSTDCKVFLGSIYNICGTLRQVWTNYKEGDESKTTVVD